jgi:hypothetical protein
MNFILKARLLLIVVDSYYPGGNLQENPMDFCRELNQISVTHLRYLLRREGTELRSVFSIILIIAGSQKEKTSENHC